MNKQDLYILLIMVVSAFASIALLVYSHKRMRNRFKNPEKFLKNIEKQISSKIEPKYFVISELQKAIALHPEHQGLMNKLKEVQESNVSKSSPKAIFLILATLIGFMGVTQLIASIFIKMKVYSFLLGTIFIIGAYFLYRNSQNYNKNSSSE